MNPTEAGSLNTSGNSCEVAWNLAFEGLATLKVNASNICGASAFSETLNILIGPEVSLPELAGQLKLKVYPNPGKGDFSISFSQSGKFDILVTDLQGRELESKLLMRHNQVAFCSLI
ncbi:MAG: T9SS type A sorting domain-containing protein [Bacteroidales bacterium]|nr:T9SS type A sorting domain-containing protein [Bacteroidales bacterium]